MSCRNLWKLQVGLLWWLAWWKQQNNSFSFSMHFENLHWPDRSCYVACRGAALIGLGTERGGVELSWGDEFQ